MDNLTSLFRAGRVLSCQKGTVPLSTGKPVSIFIVPTDDTLLPGDVVEAQCSLPYGNAVVPVVVGDWSPAIFDTVGSISSVNSEAISASHYALYYAEIKID